MKLIIYNYRIQFIDQYEAYIPNLGQIEILNKYYSEQKKFWRIFWRLDLGNGSKIKLWSTKIFVSKNVCSKFQFVQDLVFKLHTGQWTVSQSSDPPLKANSLDPNYLLTQIFFDPKFYFPKVFLWPNIFFDQFFLYQNILIKIFFGINFFFQ